MFDVWTLSRLELCRSQSSETSLCSCASPSLLLQVCYHIGKDTDPDGRDRQTNQDDIEILKRYITRCMPGLVPVPAVVESCLYTVSHG